ncbi:YbaB/EbfC family nucleoid-associated protein [Nocardia sp. NPDC019395]|uniref:YbaB/EbfC family nucleoid-associated protein n=1 Tax=Nocardia sp. NPDC019395 TaxID=3154686 RepID=UPI0033C6CB1A
MDELIAQVQQQIYRLTDLHEEMTGIMVTETSPDGSMTVEVDGNAALAGLSFTSAITRLSPEAFEKTLVETAQAAAHQAISRRAEMINTFNSQSTR